MPPANAYVVVAETLAIIVAVAMGSATAAAQPPRPEQLSPAAYAADFDHAWEAVWKQYAYMDTRRIDWNAVRARLRPQAERARDHREFIAVLEILTEQLYDHHAHMSVNTRTSPRLVPSGTDVWADYQQGRAIVTSVRGGSAAEGAGVREGMEVVEIDGRPLAEVVAARRPFALRGADTAADNWALRASIAGRHGSAVRLGLRDSSGRRTATFEHGMPRPNAPLSFGVLAGNVGYVRLHDSLGETALIQAWDSALVSLRDTRGLILDLRDTPSGGNSTVARALMSRLVSEPRAYQRHELSAEERELGVGRLWVEYVVPRGPFTYVAPMMVLVGRWTGSMGEGTAIGLDGMGRAMVIGTRMAGLLGATYGIRLPRTGFELRLPAERLYHVDGTPRETFVPRPAVPGGGEGDEVIQGALRMLGPR